MGKTLKIFEKETNNFASNATTHGFSHVSAGKRWYSKLFWGIIFLSFFSLLWYNLYFIIKSYRSYSVYTTIEKKSVSPMKFPAVTICSTGIFQESKVPGPSSEMARGSGDSLSQYANVDMRMANLFFSLKDYDDFTNLRNVTQQGETLFINKYIASCSFGLHEKCQYPADFKVVPVSPYEGNCFTFNHDGRFKQQSEGSYYGLSLMLYVNQSNMTPFTSFDEGAGVSIALHDQNEFPFPLDRGILLKPGANTRLSLKKIVTKRLQSPYPSKCSTGKDINLLFPGKYTISNCKRSCMAEYIREICNAIDLFQAKYLSLEAKRLNVTQVYCILESIRTVSKELWSRCLCPVACTETRFIPTLSFTTWPSLADLPFYKRIFVAALGLPAGISDEYVHQNFLKVNIYYEDLGYEVIQEKEEWTYQKLISDVGGQMGIWIGASLFSIVEIFVFVLNIIRKVIFNCNEKTVSLSSIRNENGKSET